MNKRRFKKMMKKLGSGRKFGIREQEILMDMEDRHYGRYC